MKKSEMVVHKERKRLRVKWNMVLILMIFCFLLASFSVEHTNFYCILLLLMLFFLIFLDVLFKGKNEKIDFDYITCAEYEYIDDNEILLNKINENISKMKYVLKSKTGTYYKTSIYIKDSFKLLIIEAPSYDNEVRKIIKDEAEKYMKHNEKARNYHCNLQVIVITEYSNICDDFNETEVLYKYNINWYDTAGDILIPIVVDRKDKKIFISGFKTKYFGLFRSYKKQRKSVESFFASVIFKE